MLFFKSCLAGVVAGTLLAAPGSAAVIQIGFDGEKTSGNNPIPPSTIDSGQFEAAYPLGLPGSASLSFDYDQATETAEILSFEMSLGGDVYALSPTASLVWFETRDEDPFLAGPRDMLIVRVDGVSGTAPLGLVPYRMQFYVESIAAEVFSSDPPPAAEFANIAGADIVEASLWFRDQFGNASGRVHISPGDTEVTVDVLPTLPLPAGAPLLLTARGALAVARRRRRA